MSSGVGAFTQKGRCSPFFQDMLHCFNNSTYPDLDCKNQVEDYMECLHHKKEMERLKTLIKEMRKEENDSSKEAEKTGM